MSKEEAQAQLQNALVKTFLTNLSFLNEYAPLLFERIDGLSKLINSGDYRERFRLEFNEYDGDFDIFDIEYSTFLYDKKPKKKNNLITSEFNFNTKGSFSILDGGLLNGKKFNKTENETIFEEASRLLSEDLNELHLALEDKKFNYKEKELKNINKIVFIGTLLGRHIPKIVSKTNAQNFFVCEKNLEIFRLSLFVVDYSILAIDGNTVVFSIMEDVHDFNFNFSNFLANKSFYNGCIKYITTDYNISSYFDPILDMISVAKSTVFNHHLMLDNITKSAFSRVNKYSILTNSFENNDCNVFKNKPVLYLGAGPSLSKNLDWINLNRDKFIVVAVAACLNILTSKNIIPDIVFTLDPQFETLDKRHFSNEIIPKIKETLIFASINTDQRILDKVNQENLYLYEVIKPILSSSDINSAFSVGDMGVSTLLNFGVKELYILGLDLALDQDTGGTHASDYHESKHDIKNIELSIEKDSFSLRQDLFYVKGNLRDKVVTSRVFNASVNLLSRTLIDKKQGSQNVYNLSTNGAYLANTIPLDIKDVKNDELKLISNDEKKSILNSLCLLSTKDIMKEDLDLLVKEKDYLEKIKNDILNQRDIKINTFESFNKKYEELYLLLTKSEVETTFISYIAPTYFNALLPYIYYYFNNKRVKKESRKLNDVSKILDTQILEILGKYINYLNILLENKKG